MSMLKKLTWEDDPSPVFPVKKCLKKIIPVTTVLKGWMNWEEVQKVRRQKHGIHKFISFSGFANHLSILF